MTDQFKSTCSDDAGMAKRAENAAPADVLRGRRVFIAEDEALVAMDLTDMIEDEGAEVLGPFERVSKCLTSLEHDLPDVAILDVRLVDGESFPVAERLSQHGIPIIFHSGHMVANEWMSKRSHVAYCGKPCDPRVLKARLIEALSRGNFAAA